ncbi:hypothetical protein [Mycobacterium sp.]|uniref:hypothetical protein n=1 Tax=Mycobacterium sp. TaxID=1785 RepID=UPI002C1885D6|nr:hypothetical protein [Mycobacterium sp.]HME49726.1 hypothetical protein [Mycobacterium sp.]
MAFTIYARGPVEEDREDPNNRWQTYSFDDDARYSVPPGGASSSTKTGTAPAGSSHRPGGSG